MKVGAHRPASLLSLSLLFFRVYARSSLGHILTFNHRSVRVVRRLLSALCSAAIVVVIIVVIVIVVFSGTTSNTNASNLLSVYQISAGMGDAVTEAELAVLLSSLSPGMAASSATTTNDSGRAAAAASAEREDTGTGTGPEVDFHDFARLFRGVF